MIQLPAVSGRTWEAEGLDAELRPGSTTAHQVPFAIALGDQDAPKEPGLARLHEKGLASAAVERLGDRTGSITSRAA